MLNKIITLKKNKDKLQNKIQSKNLCLRAKVDTGKKCNYKCDFCYYYSNLNDKTKDKALIFKDMDLYKTRGITQVDFSGGESSIHKDFIEILEYANSKFERVSMLSNGSFTEEKLYKMYDAGLDEILFSLHGWNAEIHDDKVKSVGAFNKILKNIHLCNILGIEVRINCTVDNKFDSHAYLSLINSLNITQLNFLPLNYWEDASTQKVIDYKKVAEKLITYIEESKKYSSNYQINIRYVPFCFFKGYREYLVSTFDHIFDTKDWNIQVYENNDIEVINIDKMLEQADKNRQNTYTKPFSCKQCKYVLECDGIENELINNNTLKAMI